MAWWQSSDSEPYWIEITARLDQGRELWHFRLREDGKENATTLLLEDMARGDRVLHYDKTTRTVIGMSTVAADSADSRQRRGEAALIREIRGFRRFEQPISLETFRRHSRALRRVHDDLERAHEKPLRFPFQWHRGDLRPTQAYIAKFPANAIDAVPELEAAVSGRQPPARIGKLLEAVDTNPRTKARDPFETDPDTVDRGLAGHRTTQEVLRKFLLKRRQTPCGPNAKAQEPNFDVGWYDGETFWVAEIKSITPRNEEKQLRLGLGQVLRYRHLLGPRAKRVRAALVAEYEPSDKSWMELADRLGIVLAWPEDGSFPQLKRR